MKCKKLVAIFLSTLIMSTVSLTTKKVLATTPKKGEVIIQSIEGKDVGIFSEKDGLWQSNISKSNEFIIKNNGKYQVMIKKVSIQIKSLRSNLEDKELLKTDKEYDEFTKNTIITIKDNTMILYRGSLKEIENKENIDLEKNIVLNSLEEKKLDMEIEISKEISNDAQGLESQFTFGVIYDADDSIDITNENNGNNSGANENNSSLNTDKIPLTGTVVSSLDKVIIGVIVLASGVVLFNKSNKKENIANE